MALKEEVIELKLKIHRSLEEELKEVEDELIKLIGDSGDDKLMDKFLDWQNKRIKRNESYLSILNVINNNGL